MYAHTAYISSTPIGTFSNGSQRNRSNNILKSLLLISNKFFVFFNNVSGIAALVAWIIPALTSNVYFPFVLSMHKGWQHCR